MPPARQNEHLIFNDPNEASDILCRDLGLQDKPQVYDAVRAWILRLVDQHLDLRLASYNQSKNMKRLVDQVVRDFPGYFKKHSRWRDRVHSLQAYATSYLDARQTELNGTTELSSPLWDPPKRANNIVKIKRPQSRPSKRSRTRVEQLLPALSIDSDSDMSERIQSPPPSEEEEDAEVNEHHHTPVPSKRVSYVVTSVSPSPQPSPAPQPEPSFFPEPSPGPEPSPAPEASPEPEPSPEPPGPIERFVADCYPAMRHLAAPLHRAGVVEEAHLLGMARWADETLREFLRKNDVVRTPLEEEVLIIGFSTILSDHIHAH